MRYRYRCQDQDCGLISEILKPICTPEPTIPCPRCTSQAIHVIEAPAVARAGMTNQPFDVAVGKDSERRWSHIHRQQEQRDQVRKDSQQVGLQGLTPDAFRPLSIKQRKKRTEGMKIIDRVGYRNVEQP